MGDPSRGTDVKTSKPAKAPRRPRRSALFLATAVRAPEPEKPRVTVRGREEHEGEAQRRRGSGGPRRAFAPRGSRPAPFPAPRRHGPGGPSAPTREAPVGRRGGLDVAVGGPRGPRPASPTRQCTRRRCPGVNSPAPCRGRRSRRSPNRGRPSGQETGGPRGAARRGAAGAARYARARGGATRACSGFRSGSAATTSAAAAAARPRRPEGRCRDGPWAPTDRRPMGRGRAAAASAGPWGQAPPGTRPAAALSSRAPPRSHTRGSA